MGYGGMPAEEVAVLSVGLVVGGTTADPRTWADAGNALMREVVKLRAGVASPLNVNVVFRLPGDFPPDMYVFHDRNIAPSDDLRFIAASRNYMPRLLAELRRFTRRVASTRAADAHQNDARRAL
jgi:hypothetical protein